MQLALLQVDYQSIPSHIGMELDTIQLSIFSHRFMSIAEQMGRYDMHKKLQIASSIYVDNCVVTCFLYSKFI